MFGIFKNKKAVITGYKEADSTKSIAQVPKSIKIFKYDDNKKQYKIITKEDFKRIRLNSLKGNSISKGTIKQINELWEKLSKGYNFVICVGKEECGMFYGIEYFDKHVLGEVEEESENKGKENTGIQINNIRFNRIENVLHSSEGIIGKEVITVMLVTFSYKELTNIQVKVPTEYDSIKKIKEYIYNFIEERINE